MNAIVSEDLRERLVRLETEMSHATKTLDEMSEQMKELVGLMNKGKGAQWLLISLAGIVGTVGGAVGPFIALMKH